MSDLLAIGEAMVELNQPSEGAPFVQGFGGDTSNAMIAAARLGADAAYFTAVGADRFGQALTELWMREGVDASRIAVNGGAHTGLYFVTHGADGHTFSYMRAGSAASRIGEADLPVDRIRETKILHASGISQAISSSAADAVFAAIDIARDAGRLVSYDPNLRLKLWPLRRARAIIHEAMRFCDIALPGLDDSLALTSLNDPDAIVDFYLRLGAPVVALKLGKSGVLVATAKARQRIAARAVAAIDATGAGDCFDGAFLTEYARLGDAFAAARFANVAAGLSTTGYGAVHPLPRRADVEAVMAAAK
jgi:2-dehydro-3-deoxygluconokinase